MEHNESPIQKARDQPFVVRPFRTEWDHWCKHKFDIIDKKFGSLPAMTPIDSTHWWQWDQQMINETIQAHSVVRLQYGSLNEHIQRLFDACKNTNEPRLIVSDTKIPQPHPDNVRVIVTEPLAYQFSRTFAESNLRPVYHRKVQDLAHPFMILGRGGDYGRPRLMLMLEQLGLLKDALYSVGDVNARDHLFVADAVGINSALRDMSIQILGGEYIKYDVNRNLDILPDLLNRCHFYVGVDSNGLYPEQILLPVNEKSLWGYTTTVPTLPIWHDSVARQMAGWGYRFSNIPYRQPEETAQDTVIRWCKEILFHYQITQNEQWSQSWQDSQGEITIHNFELTHRLHQIILEDVERQIAELPAEFQNL
jgi:hypothetical protein